jgi:hypothetical protein
VRTVLGAAARPSGFVLTEWLSDFGIRRRALFANGNIRLGMTVHIRLRIIISGAIVLMAASAALSKDGSLPQIDLQKQCRTTQIATDALTGTKNPNAFDLCVTSEQSAREKLVERWPAIPPLDKASCIHPTDWAASYFEWLGCIDTRVYVRKMRTEHPDSIPTSDLCPTVKWKLDGSIASVAACDFRH